MRALGFVHRTSGRGLVVFRGTDLGPSKPSSTADSCADALLFDGSTRAQLPASCTACSPGPIILRGISCFLRTQVHKFLGWFLSYI